MACLRFFSLSSSLEKMEVALEAAQRVPANRDAFAIERRRSIEEVFNCLSFSF